MTAQAIDFDQVRGDVAVAAERNQRANRPTHLVILAIGIAAVALIALLFMVQKRNDSKAALNKELGVGNKAVELVETLKTIKVAEDSTTVRYGDADLAPSKFKNAAIAAGLKNPPALPTAGQGRYEREINGVHRAKLTYEIRDESMPNLMKWVQQLVKDIPGLEVYYISLKPEATQWYLKVVFTRWERVAGGEPKK